MPIATDRRHRHVISGFGSLIVLSLMTLKPAAADWVQYRTSADRNANLDTQLDAPTDRVTELDTAEEVRATPTVFAGDLLIGNHGSGMLQRIDPASHETRWRLRAPNWIHSEIVWQGGVGVVGYGNRFFGSPMPGNVANDTRGTGESGLLAIDLESGQPRWQYRSSGEMMPTPVLHAGEVYAASGDRAIHVLSLEDGRQTGLIKLGSFVSMSSPALDDQGQLFLGGAKPYRFFRVDPATRSIVWMAEFPDVVSGLDDVSPAVDGDLVVTTAVLPVTAERFEHRLFVLDTQTGERRWEASLGEGGPVANNQSGAPTIAEGRVVVGSPTSNTLQAFDLHTGERLWRVDSGPVKAAPVIEAGKVYATTGAGELMVVDLISGREIRRLALSDEPLAPAGPVRVGQHLVIPAQDGHVYLVPLALLQ
ncbi:PQQ-binding-like beta-propeller repeat protein [Salinicola halimionae]|uniref:outer membrane protein assembly factor BamB family protein n=1 Tax=Salinicola halimionae TaxID=1949081 RepID=UPI001300BBCB|nr:PQQ-binding-like beta-propeller repeat protein [Salinicola halimionae]